MNLRRVVTACEPTSVVSAKGPTVHHPDVEWRVKEFVFREVLGEKSSEPSKDPDLLLTDVAYFVRFNHIRSKHKYE